MSSPVPTLGDIPEDEFRQAAHQAVDWIIDYFQNPDRYPVLAQVQPGELKALLPREGPDQPESMEQIMRDFKSLILPGITHWNHPGFFAYFGITGSMPGILGELLTAALNVNAMLWRTSPAATELEEVVLDWLRQWMGLPESFSGIIYDTASISSLAGIAAAREAALPTVREKGFSGKELLIPLCLYASEHAHSSIDKAAIILGLGLDSIRKIGVDSEFRLKPKELEASIQKDLSAGRMPFCVVATAGTTSTTSVDPIAEMAAICRRYDLWLHVDGAYGGNAAILPECRHLFQGCEQADSMVVNPHKWLFTPIDCSVFFCRQMDILRRTFSLVPEYLRTPEDGRVRNYMDYGPQLGRRFRALKLWMVLRSFGRQGLERRLREHMRLAQLFASWIQADPEFELCAPVPFSTVCFRACPHNSCPALHPSIDQFNLQLMEAVNANGQVFLSHTRLQERLVLRLAIGNIRSDESYIRRAWDLLQSTSKSLELPPLPAGT